MIDAKKLLKVAPFSEKTKNELLNNFDSLNEEGKYKLTQACWELISEDYQQKIQNETQKTMLQALRDNKHLTKANIEEIENKYFKELINGLSLANNQNDIEEIREKLSTETQNSLLNQDDN